MVSQWFTCFKSMKNSIHIGILWGGSEERLRQLQEIQVEQSRTLQKAKNITSKAGAGKMLRGVAFNRFQHSHRFLYIELGWQWLLQLCSFGALTWGRACWPSMVRVWFQIFFPPFHFAMWERGGGAGRTIKCTIWCDLGAARKYWWDSWTRCDAWHSDVSEYWWMYPEIAGPWTCERKFPSVSKSTTARNMPGNSSLRSLVCISQGPHLDLR